jgi:hypothetical protein
VEETRAKSVEISGLCDDSRALSALYGSR